MGSTTTNGLGPGPKSRVIYFYDEDVGLYHYAGGHPMKPHRIRMTHELVVNYGLDKKITILRPDRSTRKELTKFHTDEYVDFLKHITPEKVEDQEQLKARFNIWDDNPIFEGLYEFCSISAGGSVAAAKRLNEGTFDIAVNWAGGLHHAKKDSASGFCYINDIVLAILELLKYHQRVLYIDIDAHHGDGVEEAFYTSDRVLTVSFHKGGDFFPGTGLVEDIGAGKGKYYSVNIPLDSGIDDESYHSIFQPIMQHIMDWYRPGAVVLQCGTDSLAGDRLGCFNLSNVGHGMCVDFMKKFNVPLMLLGGGGYTPKNVSRTWCYETSRAAGVQLDQHLPYTIYFDYFGPDYLLEVPATNMPNANHRQSLEKIKRTILEHLRHITHAPSVQMQQVPQDHFSDDEMDAHESGDRDQQTADIRVTRAERDAQVVRENEYEESDDEGPGTERKHTARRNRVYYSNLGMGMGGVTTDDELTKGKGKVGMGLPVGQDGAAEARMDVD
ncbi:Hdac2 protein [Gonapodya prolifera JEL478]|uniref:Histone deacetylase n=1 Tax=Gonapodya prolifera (strain JEL478) TaxID=1344416 RepID=A0A139A2M4_GONPJ|nr:Hdac2 protein [Gonapodya prolifera JEL478]|eukprot:KXS10898.1 Hdac2 protein [Gonapodya prolifera JEL478]